MMECLDDNNAALVVYKKTKTSLNPLTVEISKWVAYNFC